MTVPSPETVAGLPTPGPATVPAVKVHLDIDDARDDARLTSIVAAVNAIVRALPVARVAAGAEDWSGDEVQHVVEGATMLAARLWRRKDSPDGIAAFGEAGPVYVQRNDPDIAMLLQLGAYARPAVG